MKIPKIITMASAIAAICLAAYSARAKADYIGAKFVSNNLLGGAAEGTTVGGILGDWHTNVDALAPTETAGVPPLCVQSNWMNLEGYSTNLTLIDSNGQPTSVKMSWYAAGKFYAQDNASYPAVLTNDTKLMDGFIECTWSYDSANVPIPPGTSILAMPNTDQPIIFLTGLYSFLLAQGGGTYSIIVYANSDGSGQGRVGQYFIDAASGTYDSITDQGAAIATDNSVTPPVSYPTPVLFMADTTQFNGTNYTQVPLTATNNANAAFGNYIEFDGLTNDMILIRTQNSGNPGAPINGIQIISLGVAIPPSPNTPEASPTNVVYGGSPITLTETAKGTPPITYQWQTLDNTGAWTNIPGANTNTLSMIMPNTGSIYTNQYIVVLTNIYSYVVAPFQASTSAVCQVIVLPASQPILTSDAGGAAVGSAAVGNNTNVYGYIGGNVTFNANFGLGTMPITNQWLFSNGGAYAPVAGIGDNPWTCTNVQSSSTGNYELSATNAIGRSNSTPVHLKALADLAAPSGNGSTNMYSYCVYTNNPWAYWKFEETTNTLNNSMQAYDYSGHNFDATYGNSDGTTGSGCLDNQPGPNTSAYYPGFPDNNNCAAMAYNHNNGNVTVPPLNMNTNTVTFTMWISPNSSVIFPSTGLFMWRNGSDAAGIGFGSNVQTNGSGENMAELGYTWNHNSPTTYNWHSGLFPPGGIWSFVACTITPSSTTMYLYYVSSGNQGLTTNLLKAVSNTANNSESFSGGNTWIGGDNFTTGRNFDGEIDEVAVFTNAMTEAQIQNLFLRSLGLTTGIPPVFTQQPTNVLIFQNQPLMMTALAAAIPAPSYQWQYESGTTWASLGTAVGRTPNSNTLVYPNWISTTITNFRCIATNFYGAATSSVATATMTPIVNYNKGLWTVNFSVATTVQYGPGTPYVGYGLLGTNTYWNALGGNTFQNTTSLRDDDSTYSGIMVSVTNAFIGTYSSGISTTNFDNILLDQYAQIFDTNNGVNFFFTKVPKGRYNVALYGCTAVWADRGVNFTVYTNGVSAGTQSVTNKQDTLFVPYDNAVVYTNLIVESGMLQVNASIVPATPAHNPSTECDFNGAQLELITWGPNVLSLTNSGTNMVLTYAGGNVLSSTNILGPWITNAGSSGVGAYTFAPTGQMRFFKVYTNVQH